MTHLFGQIVFLAAAHKHTIKSFPVFYLVTQMKVTYRLNVASQLAVFNEYDEYE